MIGVFLHSSLVGIVILSKLVNSGKCKHIFVFFVCSKGYAKFDSNLIFILPADQNIEANQLVETFSNWGPDFNINFDIIVDQVPKGWHNLLHLTTGADCCGKGTRVPGVVKNDNLCQK